MTLDAHQRRALERAATAPGAALRWADEGTARLPANTEVQAAPDAVVTCTDPDGWPALVRAIREADIPMAVRGGGWSPSGAGTVDGGVVLSLSGNAAVTVVHDRRVRIQGGALTGAVSEVLDRHSLAITLPVPSQPGLIGAALQGGVGFTFRRDGLICDSMESATLVTVDGARLEVDDDSEPEVMWALRGSGAELGIVTQATFAARPQGAVHVLQQVFGLERLAEILTWYEGWTQELSEELTAVMLIENAPPIPGLPPSTIGAPALVMTSVHVGTQERADRDLGPLSALPGALFSRRFDQTLHQLRAATDGGFAHRHFGIRTVSGWSAGITGGDTDALVSLAETMPAGESVLEVAALGGAIAHPTRASSAPGRDRRHLVNLMAIWADPQAREDTLAWFEAARPVIRQTRSGDQIVPSFADLGDRPVRPPDVSQSRLTAVRHRLDPDGCFRRRNHIAPTDPTPAEE